jgi:transposase
MVLNYNKPNVRDVEKEKFNNLPNEDKTKYIKDLSLEYVYELLNLNSIKQKKEETKEEKIIETKEENKKTKEEKKEEKKKTKEEKKEENKKTKEEKIIEKKEENEKTKEEKIIEKKEENKKTKEEKIIENKRKRNICLKRMFEYIKEKYGNEILKDYKKKLNKKSRLNKRVKFVLMMLSHYKFRQHLKAKCDEYGCRLITVTEEYTSKTCTKCGFISNKFAKREKECTSCGYKLNRDVTGSRNIIIKNINEFLIPAEN